MSRRTGRRTGIRRAPTASGPGPPSGGRPAGAARGDHGMPGRRSRRPKGTPSVGAVGLLATAARIPVRRARRPGGGVRVQRVADERSSPTAVARLRRTWRVDGLHGSPRNGRIRRPTRRPADRNHLNYLNYHSKNNPGT
jgi:hypothetical protein